MRAKEPMIFASELTGRVYVSSHYKILNEELGQIVITGKKFDVTAGFLYAAKALGYKKDQLSEVETELKD